MTPIKTRYRDAPMPFSDWRPFPNEAIVQVWNVHGESRIGPVPSFWWGYERDMGQVAEGVIIKARRLCKPREGVAA